jgi:hypothetical protein
MSNGYIQIKIGGQLRGLKFGMLAIEGILVDGAREREKKGVLNPTKSAYNLLYHGLLNNCEAKNTDPDFTFEDVMDWADDLSATEEGKSDLLRISETFANSRALEIVNGTVEKETEEEAKKKNS